MTRVVSGQLGHFMQVFRYLGWQGLEWVIIGAMLGSAKKVGSVAASTSVTGWALPGKASEWLSSGVVR